MPDTAENLRLLRVDQVGSLAAPPRLKDALEQHHEGRITLDALRQVQDEVIRDYIAKQESLGMPVISDGEFRRGNFQESFGAAVSGFDVPPDGLDLSRQAVNKTPFQRAEQDFAAPGPPIVTHRPVVERLKLVRNVPLEEYRFSSNVTTRPVKATLLSPDRISQRFDYERSRHVYKDMDAFLADVIAIERRMVQGLVDAGCRYIQIDAPGYTAYVDPVSLDRMRSRSEDPDENLERSIAADNAVIAGFRDVTFGIHFCRGNPRTTDPKTGEIVPQWHREGHYDPIAERLFNGLNHHRLLLEYDSDRAGTFEPLRFVPKDKVAVLGLVTTKSAIVESQNDLERRIQAASRFLPLDQLALSPQCGFGGVGGVVLPEDVQWAKFARILETARSVWG